MQRILATLANRQLQRPTDVHRETRRSFIASGTTKILVSISAILGAENFTAPAPDRRDPEVMQKPLSFEGVVQILKTKFPSLRFYTNFSNDHGPPDYSSIGPDSVGRTAKRLLYEVFNACLPPPENTAEIRQGLSPSPSESTTEKRQGLMRRVLDYRKRMDDPTIPDYLIVCNNDSECVCSDLYNEGYTPYLVSTWANKPENGLKYWHIFPVVKVNDRKFIIIDNAEIATIWHGGTTPEVCGIFERARLRVRIHEFHSNGCCSET